jgi:hypothetical protein
MRLVEIYKAGGRVEAESLRAALLDAGIECQLDGEPRVSMPGLTSGWNMAAVGVVVADPDERRARQILDDWRAALPPRPEPTKFIFQYGLKTIFIILTIVACVCALAKPFGELWLPVAAGASFTLVLVSVMALAYHRKRRRQLQDE